MGEASRPTPESSSSGALNSGSSSPIHLILRTLLYVSFAGALAIMGYAAFRATQDRTALKASADRLMAQRGLIQSIRKHLAPEYSDTKGRLFADPPSDPQQLLDPDVLVLAHYTDADVDTQPIDWDDMQAQVGMATGKTVVRQDYLNTADDVGAIKAGKIQIVALHAADTPYVVNNAGFIPVAVLGTEAGAHGNHLDIAVGKKSKIQKLADLRGHKLTCTAPDSITGYRAAIAVLSQEAALSPDVDYFINFSTSQKLSILGLASGDIEVVALSDDKLQSMLKKGSIGASDYRLIYESQVIPRLTIGYIYNLKPELAAKLNSVILNFKNEGGAIDETTDKPMRFFAIDYKKDFAFVRRIDDSFDPRFRKTLKAKPTLPPADSARND
jgi:phosphonate transport system substrate-binding protein